MFNSRIGLGRRLTARGSIRLGRLPTSVLVKPDNCAAIIETIFEGPSVGTTPQLAAMPWQDGLKGWAISVSLEVYQH